MGSFSIWHWLIVLVIVLVLFGRGRVADIMGEFGKGIKSFKHGMDEADKPAPRIEGPAPDVARTEPPATAPATSAAATPAAATSAAATHVEPQPAPRSDSQG